MKKSAYIIAFAFILSLSGFSFLSSTNWKIADGYSVTFTSEEPSGVFTSMNGVVIFDAEDLANSSFNVNVDVESIDTGNGMQNKHARSDKWFDAKQYPTINFTSSKISKSVAGYEALGTMTIHGVSKEVTIPFLFQDNTFTGSISIDRLDYKIGNIEGMSANASTDLRVDISVPVTK